MNWIEILRQLGTLSAEQISALESLSAQSPGQLAELEGALQERFVEVRDEALAVQASGATAAEALQTGEAIVLGIEAIRAERASRPDANAVLAAIAARVGVTPGQPAQPARPRERVMPIVPDGYGYRGPSGPVAHAVITAAVFPGMPDGRVTDLDQLGEPVASRIQQMKSGLTPRGHFAVARVTTTFPEERRFGHDERENRERLAAVTASMHASSPEELLGLTSVTASGGLCAPVDVRYEMDTISEDQRPIRDALPRFGANHGGVRGIRPPVLADVAAAVDVFTEDEDTSGVTKPCLDVSCGSTFEDLIDAVTQCLEVGNWQKQTFRENFDAYWRLVNAQHSREAETQLWDRMVALSIDIAAGDDAATQLGYFRQLVAYLAHARAAIVSRDRTLQDLTFRVILPVWVPTVASIDLLRQLPGDNTYAVTEAELRASLAAHNIAATFSPDIQLLPTLTDGVTLLAWPDTTEALLYPEGTFAFLDGGELNFGMEIRDSTLNTTNDVRSMSETFEGVSRFGPRSLHLTMDLCPSGASAGTRNYDPCTTGS